MAAAKGARASYGALFDALWLLAVVRALLAGAPSRADGAVAGERRWLLLMRSCRRHNRFGFCRTCWQRKVHSHCRSKVARDAHLQAGACRVDREAVTAPEVPREPPFARRAPGVGRSGRRGGSGLARRTFARCPASNAGVASTPEGYTPRWAYPRGAANGTRHGQHRAFSPAAAQSIVRGCPGAELLTAAHGPVTASLGRA